MNIRKIIIPLISDRVQAWRLGYEDGKAGRTPGGVKFDETIFQAEYQDGYSLAQQERFVLDLARGVYQYPPTFQQKRDWQIQLKPRLSGQL